MKPLLVGLRVRYVGDGTNRHCEATVENYHAASNKYALRLDNGALFLADRSDITVRGTR